jgi:hypothetical protein
MDKIWIRRDPSIIKEIIEWVLYLIRKIIILQVKTSIKYASKSGLLFEEGFLYSI